MKTVDPEAAIYCLKVLQEKHEILKRNSSLFVRMQKFEEGAFCRGGQKLIEEIVFLLLDNIKAHFGHEIPNSYYDLMKYFGFDYEEQKKSLELQLISLKRKLKLASKLFDFKLANRIHDQIREAQSNLNQVEIKSAGK